MYASNINKIIIIKFCQRFHLYIHAYALLLLARGLTLVQISLIESIVIGSIFLMEVPTGVLADRVGRKWSIFLSTLLLMSAEFLFIFARDFNWYIVVAFLIGTGFAFASGAVDAMVYDSLPSLSAGDRENAMKRAMGRVNSFADLAFVIAPLVGGLIIGDASVENFIPAIALTVVALLIGSLVCLTLREPASDSSEKKSQQRRTPPQRHLPAMDKSPFASPGALGRLHRAFDWLHCHHTWSTLPSTKRSLALCRRRHAIFWQPAGGLHAALRL